jgi:uroporphyrinogen decarboxylase
MKTRNNQEYIQARGNFMMTGIERINRILEHKTTDRIGLFEHFWSDTYSAWLAQGHLKEGEIFARHFGFDMDLCWSFSTVADLDFEPKVIAENEDTITMLDGNGAILRKHKKHDSTPEHVDFTVKEREQWEELKPKLKAEDRRINFDYYRSVKNACREDDRFFAWSGVNVFEMMHPVCGHENMLVGMALDPEWIHDMASTYCDLTLNLMETLFAREGKPDGIWFYEDMGYKGTPFISPDMYKEIIFPYHKKLFDYAHGLNLPVIVHSCGFVEPLIPGMIEAGMDCLQTIEVKAGMDPLRINRNFGDRIALMGGIDVRTLYTNDRAVIDQELESKIPSIKATHNYVLHSDHSIPKTVDYETYRYFIEKGLELGGS